MTWTRRILPALALSLILAPAAPLSAQLFGNDEKDEDPTRTVKGVVTDEDETPLVKAVVQLKNTRTLDVKSYYTDTEGRYYFGGLDPNVDYEIKAFDDGFQPKTRRVSSFDDRMELFYSFRLKRE